MTSRDQEIGRVALALDELFTRPDVEERLGEYRELLEHEDPGFCDQAKAASDEGRRALERLRTDGPFATPTTVLPN